MPRNTSRHEAVATIDIDIGKNTFHLVGLDRNGAIVLSQKLSRCQVEARLANMPPYLIGMEACVGAHHLSRQLKAHGHDARLMPGQDAHHVAREEEDRHGEAPHLARIDPTEPCPVSRVRRQLQHGRLKLIFSALFPRRPRNARRSSRPPRAAPLIH
jgi:transposase